MGFVHIQAFTGYLGSVEAGRQYDPTELVKTYKGPKLEILIDQGSEDHVAHLLRTEHFTAVAASVGYPVQLRMRDHFDHFYGFVSTFMKDHIEHHARALGLRVRL